MAQDSARVGYGNVVNIRSIPTRQVTRIEIELPIEAHVEATRLLFGQDVLVIPVKLGPTQAYGMVSGDEQAPSEGAPGACSAQSDLAVRQGTPAPVRSSALAALATPATPFARSSVRASLSQEHARLDIVRWLGARCREDAFQDWLGVRTEAAAVERVREMCGVSSRSEIPSSPALRQVFFRDIHAPFLASQRRRGADGEWTETTSGHKDVAK
jgi:hypothetical protein